MPRGVGTGGGGGETGDGAPAGAGWSSRTIASTVPTGTLAPGSTTIFSITPLVKISTSIAPLSVSTSATISPRSTRSPGFLRHATSVPASMSAPRIGITKSAIAPEHSAGGRDDGIDARKRRLLEVLRVRHGHLRAEHARDRPVEIIEGPLHDLRAHLGGEAAGPPALVDDDRAMGLGHRGDDGRRVQRAEDAQVDDLGGDALRGEIGRAHAELQSHSFI